MIHSPDLPAGTVAMLAAEHLDAALMRSLTKEFERRGAVHSVELREVALRETDGADGTAQAVRWSVTLDDADDSFGSQLIEALFEDAVGILAETNGGAEHVTSTVLPVQHRPAPDSGAALLMDVDSTLIDQEVIELLARHAGREAEVAAVTERAMRGELDFTQSLHARVATLEGLPSSVIDAAVDAVTPTQGAQALIGAFAAKAWPAYAVSGGFLQVLEPLAGRLGLAGFHANDLSIDQGALAGTVEGAVVDRAAKKEYLLARCAEHGLQPHQVVAIGDGANDLDMVTAAGVGVAFCPKPALAEQADLVIRHRSLELVALALGL